MMFYLLPPMVAINLVNFSKCYRFRLSYFLNSFHCEDAELLETIIPGTQMDIIGHFILRCFCLKQPSSVADFIRSQEKELFRRRLYELSIYEIRKTCKHIVKQIPSLDAYTEYSIFSNAREKPYFSTMVLTSLECICRMLMEKPVCIHLKTGCSANCTEYDVEVPFQVCLSLVKSRLVEIRRGITVVPCSKWTNLLEELFVHVFNFGLSMISNTIMHIVHSDGRWLAAFKELHEMYNGYQTKKLLPTGNLKARQVDYERKYFPPCMAHLLKVLRDNHRLTHIWRYYFSLFLKDIGLTVEQSMEFWRLEYSKSCSAGSSCTHSWQKNERKYRYSIRHLYGLEGAKREAASKDCARLQNMLLGMRDEGGCPFVHFDDTNFLRALNPSIIENKYVLNRIMEFRKSKKYSEACSIYMSALIPNNESKGTSQTSISYDSPVDYYLHFKSTINEVPTW